MKMLNDIIKGGHYVFNLHVHLVFVTKYRRQLFQKKHYEAMTSVFTDVCQNIEAKLVEMNGESDPVHLLINYEPKTSVAKLQTASREFRAAC